MSESFSTVPSGAIRSFDFNLFDLPTFGSVRDALAQYHGDDHIYVLYPRRIAAAAEAFVQGFPGDILYAVKANPHPAVLKTLWTHGVRQFDVASKREVDLVSELYPDAELFLMHPVKSRQLIRHAYAMGVRHFAVDCLEELDKIVDVTEGAADLHLHVRMALPKSTAKMPLVGKFGAGFEDAITLLREAALVSAHLGMCFHVGSQCLDVESYSHGLAYAAKIRDLAGVALDSIDVGGGFPVAYPEMEIPPMADYFSEISEALATYGFEDLAVYGEPGRALCATGGSTIARVELRKGTDLYLNDGTYGSLFDAGACAWKFPVKLHRDQPPSPSANTVGFRFFGPTCDSIDVMNGPFHLPANTGEGDWIEIEHLGAYGQSLATSFNGFSSDHVFVILE